MSGFWSKLKSMIAGPPPTAAEALRNAVADAMVERARAGRSFRPSDVALALTQARVNAVKAEFEDICNVVEDVYARGACLLYTSDAADE